MNTFFGVFHRVGKWERERPTKKRETGISEREKEYNMCGNVREPKYLSVRTTNWSAWHEVTMVERYREELVWRGPDRDWERLVFGVVSRSSGLTIKISTTLLTFYLSPQWVSKSVWLGLVKESRYITLHSSPSTRVFFMNHENVVPCKKERERKV